MKYTYLIAVSIHFLNCRDIEMKPYVCLRYSACTPRSIKHFFVAVGLVHPELNSIYRGAKPILDRDDADSNLNSIRLTL